MKTLFHIILLLFGFNSLFAQKQFVINQNTFVRLSNSVYLVINNPNTNAITTVGLGGNIISENEFNVVAWYIGANTGNYVVPFTTGTLVKIPLAVNIITAGIGASSNIIFSTYETTTDVNTPYPSDVNNMNSNCNNGNALYAVDRFWRIDAGSYTTKPEPVIDFSYNAAPVEIGGTNTIIESKLKAERFNSNSNSWETPQKLYGIDNPILHRVSGASVSPVDFYKSWTLIDTTIMTIKINVLPNNPICLGNKAVITPSGAATYTMIPSLPPLTTNTSFTVSPISNITYTISGTNALGCLSVPDSAAVTTITVNPVPVLTATFTNVTCNGLNNGTATALATGGTPFYTYAWNTVPPQISLTGVASGLAAGAYTVGVKDANGCIDSTSITITQPAILKDSITTFVNVSCFGLHNGSATGGVTGGTTPYTYSWSNGNNLIKDTALVAGVYTLTVTDAHLCKDTVSVRITQPTLLKDSTITFKNDSCFGNSNGSATAIFVGGTSNYTYSWAPSGGSSSTATNLPANNYTITAIDAHLCKATATVTINQPPKLTVVSTPKLICIRNTTTLTATAVGGNTVQPYSYSIAGAATNTVSVNPITTTVYTLQVKDVKGCLDSNKVTVFVRDSLKFLAVSPSVKKCPGFSANLNATGKGGDSTFTYTWMPGSIVSQNITVTPATTTVYTLTLSDACGTPTITAYDTVTINALPVISFTVNQKTGCAPLCVQFTNTTTILPVENITYNWNLGAGYSSQGKNPYQCYSKPGTYTVGLTATSAEGCISKTSVPNMITVYNLPSAAFYSSPDDATIINPTIQFTGASTAPGSSISHVLWQYFGDGSDSTSVLSNTTHTYKDTGTFCTKLLVTNTFGCKDSVTQCVIIKPYFTLYIPNSFTPNDDGRNEIFNVAGDYISSFDMKIFDRWGNQLFHSSDIKNGWNGSKNGEQLQEDVYVYVVNVWDTFNNPHEYKGTVTIIK